MATYSAEVIEKYRNVLRKNPHSQVFAPLADAYRELNQLDLAEKICREGLKHHPDFAGGWVVLGKILKDKKQLDEAIKVLQQAVQLSGDNILAHILLGEVFLEKRDANSAIKSFKMVLFFNPQHIKVKKILEKIESMTAKDYGDDLFQFKKLTAHDENKTHFNPELGSQILDPKNFNRNSEKNPDKSIEQKSVSMQSRSLLRVISLLDAFIARNELKKAQDFLEDAKKEFPDEKELLYRERILKSKNQFSFLSSEVRAETKMTENEVSETLITNLSTEKLLQIKQKKLKVLNSLLQIIEDRKNAFF